MFVDRNLASAVTPGCLLLLKDDILNRRILVDTVVAYSVFSHSSETHLAGPRLKGPAGRINRCWGHKKLYLIFNGLKISLFFFVRRGRISHFGS